MFRTRLEELKSALSHAENMLSVESTEIDYFLCNEDATEKEDEILDDINEDVRLLLNDIDELMDKIDSNL